MKFSSSAAAPRGGRGHGDTGTRGYARCPEAQRLGGPDLGRHVDRLISWPVGQNGQRAGTRVLAAEG